jgi:hypothetical protein
MMADGVKRDPHQKWWQLSCQFPMRWQMKVMEAREEEATRPA